MRTIEIHELRIGLRLFLAVSLALAACRGGGREDTGAGAAGGAPQAGDTAGIRSDTPSAAAAPEAGSLQEGQIVVADAGFQTPESVLYDERADAYLVSNINGSPFEKDDNGFISRVSPEGKVLELKWIDGAREDVTLHGPKGLAAHGDSLFVADIDSVRVFDRVTGRSLGSLGVPGASFLNDVATARDGTLYVTDTGIRQVGESMEPTGTDALYRFEGGRAVAVVKGKELGGPNGVAVDAEGPVLVTFNGGKVYRIAPDGGPSEIEGAAAGQLDGVVILEDGSLVLSSWEKKAVFRFWSSGEREGQVATLGDSIESPADIGYDPRRRRILVPSFTGNRVESRSTEP